MPGPVADVAAITIAATVGTAPLMALHFEQVSLAALPANLLAAAAIAPMMWLGMLARGGGAGRAGARAPVQRAQRAAAGVRRVGRAHVRGRARRPSCRCGSARRPRWRGAYAALAAAIARRRARPGGAPPRGVGARPPRPRRVAALAAVALAAPRLRGRRSTTGSVAPPAPGELVVSFLDIGQGDATLLQKDGAAVLVDTGPPGGPILRRLRRPASSGSTRS